MNETQSTPAYQHARAHSDLYGSDRARQKNRGAGHGPIQPKLEIHRLGQLADAIRTFVPFEIILVSPYLPLGVTKR